MGSRRGSATDGQQLVVLERWHIELTGYAALPDTLASEIARSADAAIRRLTEEAAARLRLQQPDCGIHLRTER